MRASISMDGKGEPCRFSRRVLDLDGRPVAGARLDVWSDNVDGFDDVQHLGIQPRWNNRGIFTTGPDGTYDFIGIKPVSFPVPVDGPAGEMLTGMGRHPFRPAQTHLIVTAPVFQKLVTQIFIGDDPLTSCWHQKRRDFQKFAACVNGGDKTGHGAAQNPASGGGRAP